MRRAIRIAAVSTVAVVGCSWASYAVSQTLTLFQSEGEFLANAPIVSTENFDSFATPTVVFEPSIVIDEVMYTKPPGTTCLDAVEDICWSITDSGVGPPPVTLPNKLRSSGGEIRDPDGDIIGFGENQSVKAFGFYFIGLADLDLIDEFNIVMFGWEIVVHETDGTATTFDLPPITAAAAAYFGFVSEIGILSLEIGAKGPPTNISYSTFPWGYDNVSRAAIEPVVQEISIDIKPGSDPNSINLKSKGKIPVAILTTNTFDATQVDWETVGFGPDGATESHGRSHVKDVDGDGDMDVAFHFNTQETGIQCGDADTSLTGETFDGQAISGTDAIVTVNCP